MATDNEHLMIAFRKLSPNNFEAGLPGREKHCQTIYNFLHERLKIRKTSDEKRARRETGQIADIKSLHMNKTIFICGVPGTGKTASVMSVIKKLTDLRQRPDGAATLHDFVTVTVNGQHLDKPDKVYSEILHVLTGQNLQPGAAMEELQRLFMPSCDEPNDDEEEEEEGAKRPRKSTASRRNRSSIMKKADTTVAGRCRSSKLANVFKILVIDELDLLYNEKKQDIFYNLFDWPTSSQSKVIVVAIANAMDLSERYLRSKTSSRLGWEKLVFESYNSELLEQILITRLGKELLNECFDTKAVILATKRIGRTTGDARRVLDTCREALQRAFDDGLTKVTASVIDSVGMRNVEAHRNLYLNSCAPLELLLLKAINNEARRVGEDRVAGLGVLLKLQSSLKRHPSTKKYCVGPGEYDAMLNRLAGVGLIYLESDKPTVRKRMHIKNPSETFLENINSNIESRIKEFNGQCLDTNID